MSERILGRPLFVFDGDCGVCQNGTDSMRRRFDPPVDMTPYQTADLDRLGIAPAKVLDGPILVRTDGSHVVGPMAIAEVLSASRAPYRMVGRVMRTPGIRHALIAMGPRLYEMRHRLPGAATSCPVVPATSAVTPPLGSA